MFGIIEPGPGKPLRPGGIPPIPKPGGPGRPGGGPIGGIGDDGCPCGIRPFVCEFAGLVRILFGIMLPCACDVGEMDLDPGATCGVLGEEP
jgi:hypothetical protein